MAIENAIIVINKTRLEQLVERFNTRAQAKFYIEHSGADFIDYEKEDYVFKKSLEIIQNKISSHLKFKIIERKFLPNFIFSDSDIAVVVGQDGLVANTAKYLNGKPILAINPDLNRYDGILMPYNITNFEKGLIKAIEFRASFQEVTMAEAILNNGQRLLAFNDLFMGPSSHISARYKITFNNKSEAQSSSGIIISTGAGSTGWLSSLINMSNGINSAFCEKTDNISMKMRWDDNKLIFIVREPFQSKYSEISLTTGIISNKLKLVVESFMPQNGIIFSDGIEADYLNFNSGSIVEIGIAEQKAKIINL